MALHMYADEFCKVQFTEGSLIVPDVTRGSAPRGYVDVARVFIKNDDVSRVYRNISLTSMGATEDVSVEYALDAGGEPGEFALSLNLPDILDTSTVITVWRRVTVKPGQSLKVEVSVKHVLDFEWEAV